MSTPGPQPLAGIADIFFAGLAVIAWIAGYLALAAGVCAAFRWWRRWRARRPRLRDLMDAGDGQGGVPPLRGLAAVIRPDPRIERLCCGRCRTENGRLPCNCAIDCYSVVCLQWDAVSEVQR